MTLLLYYSFDGCVEGVEILNRTWETMTAEFAFSRCPFAIEDLKSHAAAVGLFRLDTLNHNASQRGGNVCIYSWYMLYQHSSVTLYHQFASWLCWRKQSVRLFRRQWGPAVAGKLLFHWVAVRLKRFLTEFDQLISRFQSNLQLFRNTCYYSSQMPNISQFLFSKSSCFFFCFV